MGCLSGREKNEFIAICYLNLCFEYLKYSDGKVAKVVLNSGQLFILQQCGMCLQALYCTYFVVAVNLYLSHL